MKIKTLKTEEKLTMEVKPTIERSETEHYKLSIGLWPKQPEVGVLLIAIGLLGLTVQAGIIDSQIWNYWWLVFVIMPCIQKWPFFSRKQHSTVCEFETFSAESTLKQ